MSDFREGARVGDPDDRCPGCGTARPHFVTHFKKFGEHRVVVCLHCRAVFDNGRQQATVTLHPPPAAAGEPAT